MQVQTGRRALLFFARLRDRRMHSRLSPLRLTGVPAAVPARHAGDGQGRAARVDGTAARAGRRARPSRSAGSTATTGADGTAARHRRADSGPRVRPGDQARAASSRRPSDVRHDGVGRRLRLGRARRDRHAPAPRPAGKDTTAPTATIAGLEEAVRPRARAARAARDGVGRPVRHQVGPARDHAPQGRSLHRVRRRARALRGAIAAAAGSRSGSAIGPTGRTCCPKRLGRGRYTIRVVAIDKAGNDGATRDEDPGPMSAAARAAGRGGARGAGARPPRRST